MQQKPSPSGRPSAFPATTRARNAWILEHRASAPGGRQELDPLRPYAYLVEPEASESGGVVDVATLFLTNRECPWRCLMCDLWKNTLTRSVEVGAIVQQIDFALNRLAPARQIKLYNSGSFFDAKAIPPEEHAAIAQRCGIFERVIVECHPALVGPRVLQFRDLLARHGGARLEVAMGLESVHPQILERLNKGMDLEGFAQAARFLSENGIALRSFILLQPPFLPASEAVSEALRAVDFAQSLGSTVAAIIPTRVGNGAMEVLERDGSFTEPRLAALEEALLLGIQRQRGRVFADLWDLERFSDCPECLPAREQRLHAMNLRQVVLPAVTCSTCGAG